MQRLSIKRRPRHTPFVGSKLLAMYFVAVMELIITHFFHNQLKIKKKNKFLAVSLTNFLSQRWICFHSFSSCTECILLAQQVGCQKITAFCLAPFTFAQPCPKLVETILFFFYLLLEMNKLLVWFRFQLNAFGVLFNSWVVMKCMLL